MSIHNTLAGRPLKDWYTIEIVTDGDTKSVYFLSRIHVNKRVHMGWFSAQFSDHQILMDRDLYTRISKAFGDTTQ